MVSAQYQAHTFTELFTQGLSESDQICFCELLTTCAVICTGSKQYRSISRITSRCHSVGRFIEFLLRNGHHVGFIYRVDLIIGRCIQLIIADRGLFGLVFIQ
ncbi:hypothetical protein D3C72_1397370 [compost metagenome]